MKSSLSRQKREVRWQKEEESSLILMNKVQLAAMVNKSNILDENMQR